MIEQEEVGEEEEQNKEKKIINIKLLNFINEYYQNNNLNEFHFNIKDSLIYKKWINYFIYKTTIFTKINSNFKFKTIHLIIMMMEYDKQNQYFDKMLNMQNMENIEELHWSEIFNEWIFDTLDINNCYYNNNFSKKNEIIDKLKLFIEEKDFFSTLPSLQANVICYKCKSDQILYDSKQTRSSDEGAKFFFTCLKCNSKW